MPPPLNIIPTLRTDTPTARLLSQLDVKVHAFFFDFDGTLVDISETPDVVEIPDGLIADLGRLCAAADGALAIISGRPIVTLDRFLSPLRLAASGVHGLEHRQPGAESIEAPMQRLKLDGARRVCRAMARADPRLVVEDKGLAVALHYRRAPDLEPWVFAAVRHLPETHGGDVVCQVGKMVVELRLAGADKGGALRGLMSSPVFVGRVPVMFGDDLTDESAFEAARRAGGLAIHVGPSSPPASALHALPGPSAVRRLIAVLAAGNVAKRPVR